MEKINAACKYHQDTSYERGKLSGHYLDWRSQPSVYKIYKGIDPMPLPENMPSMGKAISKVLKEDKTLAAYIIDIEQLSTILRLTWTLTAKTPNGGHSFYYRSAASAGALYPTEIYVATHGVKGLDDGLYHFGIHGHSLTPLRTGDLSGFISGLLHEHSSVFPVITFIFTAIFFRSSWKYRDRAYRYHLLDTGHIIENLHIAIRALEYNLRISYDFDDKGLNRLIGLDDKKEASLATAYIQGQGVVHDSRISEIEDLSDNIRDASIVSGREVQYSNLLQIHHASESVFLERDNPPELLNSQGLSSESWESIPQAMKWPKAVNYPECLFKRRSERNFVNKPIDKRLFLSLLDVMCEDGASDPETESRCNYSFTMGFIAGDIEDLTPGIYLLDRGKRRFGLTRKGLFMEEMAKACLDQLWLKNANLHFIFIADIDLIDQQYGTRGYRYAMMGSGRMGERIYIASASLGLGCCGIGAFYDREASDILGLNGSLRLLYLVAAGRTKHSTL